MTDRELMQQALEALEFYYDQHGEESDAKVITALRERLAQPEQKPVAWGVFDGPNLHDTFFTEDEAQEMVRLKGDGSIVKPLYATPPRREWVGLPEEERRGIREWQRIQEELGPVWAPMMLYLYEAIEAKLRERNA